MPGRQLTASEQARISGSLLLKLWSTCFRLQKDFLRSQRSAINIIRNSLSDPDIATPKSARLINGKVYFHLNVPGYPSKAFDRVFENWLSHSLGLSPQPGLRTCYINITNKCALSCDHCFEWESRNQPGDPSVAEIIFRIEQLISLGCGQVVFTGGEPVTRLVDILRILRHFQNDEVAIWINTAGSGLTSSKLQQLKQHGLAGILFSLDHFKAEKHDQFRGRPGCFKQAIQSVQDAGNAGLITALSLCATRCFVTPENLDAYQALATRLEVDFIQLLEPKAVGKYAGMPVGLPQEQQEILEDWFLASNRPSGDGSCLPIISYADLIKRRQGCIGGKLYAYLHANGKISPCPFCQSVSVDLKKLDQSLYSEQLACPADQY